MGDKSVLSVIGKDVKSVFSWIGSAKTQSIIAEGEAGLLAIYPPAAGILAIANAGLIEAIKIEALAAGAGSQSGSGTQKSAALVSALTPEILTYAQMNGFPVPTSDKIQSAANSLVAFLNTLDGSAA